MTLVRRLHRYYAHVRLLARVHVQSTLVASRTDPRLVGISDAGVQFLDVWNALGLRRVRRDADLELSPLSIWPSR